MLSTVLALAGLGGAPAFAQEVLLPVQDLLCDSTIRPGYLDHIGDEYHRPSRLFAGETQLGGRPLNWDDERVERRGSGYFTESQLQDILGAVGIAGGARIWNGALVVTEGDAEQARERLAQLRRALPPLLAVHARLVETKNGKVRVRFERHAELVPGRVNVLSDLRERTAVLDFDVEIAQASMISNPMHREVRSGTMLAIRPQLTPSAEWGLLEVIARCADDDPSSKIETGHHSVGPIDRVPLQIAEAGRVVLARPGKTTVHRWSSQQGAFELALTVSWQLRPPVRVGGQDFGVFSVRGGLPGFRSVRVDARNFESLFNPDDDDDPWSLIEDIAGAEAQWLSEPDLEEAPFAERYVAVGRAHWAAGAAVMRWFESKTAGPVVTIRCLEVPAGTAVDAALAEAPPAGVHEVASATMSQVDGTWSTSAVRRDRTVLYDWDCEVANASRIPDPKCRRMDDGAVFNVRRFGDRFEVEIDLSRELDAGLKELTLGAAVAAPPTVQVSAHNNSVQQSSSPAVQLPADQVIVEQPLFAQLPVRFGRTVAAGQRATWRASANELLGDGRELLVVLEREK